MQRVQPKKRGFVYRERDPQLLLRRIGVAPENHTCLPTKPKPITGTETLLHHLRLLERSKAQAKAIEHHIAEFLTKRPRLQQEFNHFLAAGGGTRDDLAAWLREAAARQPAIIVRGPLRLVVSN